MGYASLENKQMMAASFDDIPNWNHDLENAAMAVKDYWEDFSKAAPAMNMPVLFFYGRSIVFSLCISQTMPINRDYMIFLICIYC